MRGNYFRIKSTALLLCFKRRQAILQSGTQQRQSFSFGTKRAIIKMMTRVKISDIQLKYSNFSTGTHMTMFKMIVKNFTITVNLIGINLASVKTNQVLKLSHDLWLFSQ